MPSRPSVKGMARLQSAIFNGGFYEARSTVDIPVLGLGEEAMLYGCTLGQKIGLVTINSVFIPMHEEQIQRYGLSRRVVAVKAIETDPATAVALNRFNGTAASRLATFQKPSAKALREFLDT
jgi:allantoin racemase